MPVWDRLRGVQRGDDGAPTPSRQKLEAWQNAHSPTFKGAGVRGSGIQGGNSQYSYAISGPGPKKSGGNNSKLATPSAKNSYRDSDYGRPTSSIYSQPPSVAATYAAQQLRNSPQNDANDVSPPSSPEAFHPTHRDGGDVSPIDEVSDMSQLSAPTTSRPDSSNKETRSSIPTLRRERRKNSDAAANALRQQRSNDRLNLKPPRPYGNDVRWDPDTGEPTTSNKGRPSQIDPREFVQGLGNRNTSVSPRHIKQAQQHQSAFGDRVRRMRGSPDPQPEPAPRPEWRGASGRSTLAQPLQDNHNVTPLNIPPRSEKRIASTTRGTSNAASTANATPILTAGPRSVSTPVPQKTDTEEKNGAGDALSAAGQQRNSPVANPDPKTKVGPDRPQSNEHHFGGVEDGDPHLVPRPLQPAAKPAQASPPAPISLQVPSNEKATRRKSIGGTTTGHSPQPSGSSSLYSQPEPRQHLQSQQTGAAPPSTAPAADDWVQPPSRFSVTTYGTSNHTDSRRPSTDSEAPPLPPPPTLTRPHTPSYRPSSATSSNSIMERGRPIVSGYEKSPRLSPSDPVRISLGATYLSPAELKNRPQPARTGTAGDYGSLSVRPVSREGGEKDLPPAPPETESASGGDRVAQLSARVQALGNRRINLQTAIRQMTELMPADSVLASEAVARKREAERRKVAALRAELADVEREAHDAGLRLHRARKRADRDAEYEPTTLWVRRVTG